jgi:hypothetical protein
VRQIQKTTATLAVLWLLAFVGLTIATYDAGNSGEDGWSMTWGYPPWVGFQSSDLERFPPELSEGQVALLHGFTPKNGNWHLDGIALLLAFSVPFAPIVLCITGYAFSQNHCRFHLSTLLMFVLICAILLGLNTPKISAAAWAWPSGFWLRVRNCCILVWPSISATITLCFLVAVVREWRQRRTRQDRDK